jgi:uncharacterized protein YyaL (SSP411 family)
MVNRLAEAKSPYLLLHKDDPIDWQPFDEQALAEAKARKCPVLISVGYATCHWCHVMRERTFNNPEVAELLNARFVSIKIDREERPDLDAVYMEALVGQRGSGGWPITVFADEQGRPVVAFSYLPPHDEGQMPGFIEIALKVAALYSQNPAEFAESGREVLEALQERMTFKADGELPGAEDALTALREALIARYDRVHAGFGTQPKFPQAHWLWVLWWLSRIHDDPEISEVVVKTLLAMANGGIFDPVDGGFYRYSTDRYFMIPHFEKMLIDQADLLYIYSLLASGSGARGFGWIASRIIEFVEEFLRRPDGLLSNATDADSDGIEGRYHVFSASEIREQLGASAAALIDFYQVSEQGNFEGKNVLHRAPDPDFVPPAEVAEGLRKLSEFRQRRSRLFVDDKAILDANAEWAWAKLQAGRFTSNSKWVDEAVEFVKLLEEKFLSDPDLLSHCIYADGSRLDREFATDYLWLIAAEIAVYEITGGTDAYETIVRLANSFVKRFVRDGLVLASAKPGLLQVTDRFDSAHSSAASLAPWIIHRVAVLTDDERLLQVARELLHANAQLLSRSPDALTLASWSLYEQETGLVEVVIPGSASILTKTALEVFKPNMLVITGEVAPRTIGLDIGKAYLCRHRNCSLPIEDPIQLRESIEVS